MSMCMSVFVHLQNRQAAVQRGLGWCETSKVSLIRRYHRLKQLFSYLVLSRGQNWFLRHLLRTTFAVPRYMITPN